MKDSLSPSNLHPSLDRVTPNYQSTLVMLTLSLIMGVASWFIIETQAWIPTPFGLLTADKAREILRNLIQLCGPKENPDFLYVIGGIYISTISAGIALVALIFRLLLFSRVMSGIAALGSAIAAYNALLTLEDAKSEDTNMGTIIIVVQAFILVMCLICSIRQVRMSDAVENARKTPEHKLRVGQRLLMAMIVLLPINFVIPGSGMVWSAITLFAIGRVFPDRKRRFLLPLIINAFAWILIFADGLLGELAFIAELATGAWIMWGLNKVSGSPDNKKVYLYIASVVLLSIYMFVSPWNTSLVHAVLYEVTMESYVNWPALVLMLLAGYVGYGLLFGQVKNVNGQNLAMFVAIMSITMTSCSGDKNSDNEMNFVPVKSNGQIGYMAPDGSLYYIGDRKDYKEFDGIPLQGGSLDMSYPPVAFGSVAATIYRGEAYGYIISSPSEAVTIFKSKEISDVGEFGNGLIPIVREGGYPEVLDIKGNTVFTLSELDGFPVVGVASHYSDGLLMVFTDNLGVGYVDTKGNCVIPPNFYGPLGRSFFDGHTCLLDDKMRLFILDTKGKKTFEFPEGTFLHPLDFRPVAGGYFVNESSTHGISFYDYDGNRTELSDDIVDIVDAMTDYFIYCDINGLYGINSYDGKSLLEPIDAFLLAIDNDHVLKHSDSDSIIRPDGTIVADLSDYKNVRPIIPQRGNISNFGLTATKGGTHYYLDKNGSPLREDVTVNISGPLKRFLCTDSLFVDFAAASIALAIEEEGAGEFKIGRRAPSYVGRRTYDAENTLDCVYNNNIWVNRDDFGSGRKIGSIKVLFRVPLPEGRDWEPLISRIMELRAQRGYPTETDEYVFGVYADMGVVIASWQYKK